MLCYYPLSTPIIESRFPAVKDLGRGPYDFGRTAGGIVFEVPIPARETVAVRIVYRQPVTGSRATYVVTTTRDWRRPLDRALFKVCWPEDLEDARLSYEGKETPGEEGETCRRIAWSGYMPDRNIVLTWSGR